MQKVEALAMVIHEGGYLDLSEFILQALSAWPKRGLLLSKTKKVKLMENVLDRRFIVAMPVKLIRAKATIQILLIRL